MDSDIQAVFQVAVRIMGSFDQELIVMSQVVIREHEASILDAPNFESLILSRAITNIIDYVRVGELHGDIIALPTE